jgi:hypothetical protein
MRLCRFDPVLIVAIATAVGAPSTVRAQDPHPTLLLTTADIASLRDHIVDGGDDARAWDAIVARWPALRTAAPETLLTAIGGCNAAGELGLLAHLGDFGSAPAETLRRLALAAARSPEDWRDDFRASLRLRTLALGYDMAFAVLSGAERDELRDAMYAGLTQMPSRFEYTRYAHNPFTSNRGATAGAAIGLAAIALWPEATPEQRDILVPALAFGHELVRKCLTDNLAADGAYREGVLYAGWTMRMALPYIEARRRFDGHDLARDPRIARMAEWLAYEVLPEGDGATNNVNDSPLFSRPLAVHGSYLAWARSQTAIPLAAWLYRHVAGDLGGEPGENGDRVASVLWCRSGAEVDPATVLPASRLFEDRGQYVHRSGFKHTQRGSEILFSFYAGRFFGGHAQEDQGQFTLYAYGDRYAVDNGAVYPTLLPKDSRAHNIVLVDDRGQHNAGQSIGTDARIASAMLAPSYDWLRADLDSAYATHSPFNAPGVPFPGTDWSWGYDGGNPMQRAERTVLVVHGAGAPTWMLIADDIQKDTAPHAYEWALHTDAGNAIDLGQAEVTIYGAASRLHMVLAGPHAEALRLAAHTFENGGEDPATTRITARVDAIAPGFVVAMLPLPAQQPAPVVSHTTAGGATRLEIDWSHAQDVVVVNPRGAWTRAGSLRTDARLAAVRRVGGEITAFMIAEGRVLEDGDVQLIALDATASATFSGTVLQLDDERRGFTSGHAGIATVCGPGGGRTGTRPGPGGQSRPELQEATAAAERPATGWAIALGCAVQPARLRIAIHDVRGRLVRDLQGPHALTAGGSAGWWDGRDARGIAVASGVYFARVTGCDAGVVRRLTVVR